MSDFSSAFIVEEMGGENRTIRLVGSAQPFRPAMWEVTQKVVTTWNPGNGVEAVQHVLGPQDVPGNFEGFWRRTLLGRTPAVLVQGGSETQIVHPFVLHELFDELTRLGRQVKVTWAATDGTGIDRGKLVRVGRITKYSPSFDRVDDIGWKMTFDWSGRGRPLQRVSVSREGNIISALNKMQAAANSLATIQAISKTIKSNATIPKSASQFSIGQLEQLANLPNTMFANITQQANKIVNDLDRIGGVILKVRALPLQLVNSALAVANNAMAVANRFADKISKMPPELMVTRMTADSLLNSYRHFAHGSDAAMSLSQSAHALKVQALGSSTSRHVDSPRKMLGLHVVRTGDTMGSIALRWYGNADLTDPICRANKIPTSTVTPTRATLVIPNPAAVSTV